MIRFLVSSDAFGASHSGIISAADLSQIGADASLINQLDEGGRPLSADDRFVTARFVRSLIDTNSKYLEDLTKLASIGLLTEVADEFLKPTAIAKKSDLTIVLDTAVVCDYIELYGRELKENAVLILESLRSIGCKLVVFNTTCSEMQRNLQSMLRLPAPSRHGQTHQAMIRQETLPDYVNSVARNPEKAVEVAGITISPIEISNFPSLHRYFDEDRRTDFYSDVFWVQDRARDHDTDCMTLLMRLRQGKRSSDIFDCGYVFVTRNPIFARKARSYCLQSRLINDWQEGPVVHLSELATVAWLRTGFGGAEAIPRAYLVASCERILRLRPEVSEAVAAKLKSLTPEIVQQYEALLLDSRSVMRLADETMNDESIVTDENAMRLFDVMKKSIVEEELERHKLYVEEMAAVHAAELASERELQQKQSDRQRIEFEELVTNLEETNKRRATEAEQSRLEQERSALAAEHSRAELEKRLVLEVKSREANQISIVNGMLHRINRRNKFI